MKSPQGVTIEELGPGPPPVDSCVYQFLWEGRYCERTRLAGSEYCYWHYADASKYRAESIESYFGSPIELEQAIRKEIEAGANLQGAYLEHAPLRGTFLGPGANLSGADLRAARLRGLQLSYGSLRNANLAVADLEEAYLADVDFSGCNLAGAKMFRVKLRNSDLSGVLGLTASSFRSTRTFLPRSTILEEYPNQAEGAYRQLVAYFTRTGDLEGASWAAYRYRVMLHRECRSRLSLSTHIVRTAVEYWTGEPPNAPLIFIRAVLAWMSNLAEFVKSGLYRMCFGYGEKPLRVAVLSGVVILFYAFFYSWAHALTDSDLKTALYFSIVTFTTLGYGDVLPIREWRLLAASEAMAGVLLAGLFLFTLSRRAIGRG